MTACTVCLACVFSLLRVPAAILLAAIISGIFFALSGANVKVPQKGFYVAQSAVGAVIAASITTDSIRGIAENGFLFLLMVLSVSVVSSFLGYLLARTQLLPGTTAIWGTSPGAALTMIVMSESYGADSRLVAFMQYLRVIMVTFTATIVASIWGGQPTAPVVLPTREAVGEYTLNVVLSILLCCVAAFIALRWKLPLASMLFPLIVGAALNISGVMHVGLPRWLSFVAYVIVGWNIGLRFNRPILIHAFHALPRIAMTMFLMIVVCGIAAAIFSYAAGIDMMSAFLATSPGGIDSVAIIAASVGGDVSLVMAVQTLRLMVVVLTGPALATFVVRRTGWKAEGDPDKNDK